MTGCQGWQRTRTVACARCRKVFIRLTADRYMVCLGCVTEARLLTAGFTAGDPALARIAAHNASVLARAGAGEGRAA
jgi:hypothetical protein